MAKTSLIISSTAVSDGKKLQKTLTDINSAATNDQLKSFAQVLNNLTTNTYIETNRVDRTNCDSESGAGGLGKAFRNMAITGAGRGSTATVTFDTDGAETVPKPAVFFVYQNGGELAAQFVSPTAATSDDPGVAKYTFTCLNQATDIFAGIGEKDSYYAEFVKVVVS